LVRRALIAGAALIALGAGVLIYVATRPSADVDGIGSSAIRGFGAKPVHPNAMPRRQWSGTGTVIAAFSATNPRDHDVKLSVPKATRDELAQSSVRAEVLFVPLQRSGGWGNYQRESDLKRGSTTMPAKGDGEIVHVFHVDRCQPGETWVSPSYALDVDGHTAQVEVALTSDKHEFWSWDRDITDEFGRLRIGGC
jgi:hypothetical protein